MKTLVSVSRTEHSLFKSPDELASTVATLWLDDIEKAARTGKPYCVALSGGRITKQFFEETAVLAAKRKTSFGHVHFFWADERCVPPTDPDSNFKLAKDLLFGPLKIAADKIHRLRGEDSPQVGVEQASAELLRVATRNQDGQPVFDLIFLGMGEDGHVASLFPNAPAKIMDISVPFLVVENSPKPPPTRLSLSYKTIFAAKNVWVLVSGAGKEKAFKESLSPEGQTPLARVIRNTRRVKIFSVINEF